MSYTFSLCFQEHHSSRKNISFSPHFTNVQNATHASKGRFIKENPVSVPCLYHFSHQYFPQNAEQQEALLSPISSGYQTGTLSQSSRNIPVSLPAVQRCGWHKPPRSQSSWLSPSSSTLSSSLPLFLLLDDFLRIFKTLFTLFIWSQGCREGTGSPQLRYLSSSSSQGRRDS